SAVQCSATRVSLPDDPAAIVCTDPPYYAAVPYADLSDFFYSWHRRSLQSLHLDFMQTELAPKDEECVSLAHRAAMYRNKDAPWFEKKMKDACDEACRVTPSNGLGIFVFANKETAGWEAMLAALIASGWTI